MIHRTYTYDCTHSAAAHWSQRRSRVCCVLFTSFNQIDTIIIVIGMLHTVGQLDGWSATYLLFLSCNYHRTGSLTYLHAIFIAYTRLTLQVGWANARRSPGHSEQRIPSCLTDARQCDSYRPIPSVLVYRVQSFVYENPGFNLDKSDCSKLWFSDSKFDARCVSSDGYPQSGRPNSLDSVAVTGAEPDS